jgi:hypothetical protein
MTRARERAPARRSPPTLAILAALALGLGCGSSAPRNELPSRRLTGEAALEDDERPRFVVEGLTLPEPPASVDVDEPALEPVLRHARELLARPLPTPEDATTASELGAFVEGRLAGWMNATAQGIRSLWGAMQALETRVLGAHVVARAITGATLLALAERLEAVPLPAAIRADATLASGIRDALDNASRPMRERAIQAFGACASESIGSADPTLDEWRLHCDAESTRASAPRHE